MLLLFAQIVSYGQSFDFISGVGIRNAQDHSKGFVVYSFPGMAADDIKAAVLSKIPAIYPSTGRVQSGDNNNIVLVASTETALFKLEDCDNTYDARQGSHDIGADFTIIMYFKDGKIRYDAPSFQRLFKMLWSQRGSYPTYGNMLDPIEVWINTNRKQISTVAYFNNLVKALNKAIEEASSKPSDW